MIKRFPEPVGCMRGNLRTGFTHDAEISFGYGGPPHLLVSTGHKTHEEVKEAARQKIAPAIAEMLAVMQKHFAGLKEAKP
jgi:hypothetical protein